MHSLSLVRSADFLVWNDPTLGAARPHRKLARWCFAQLDKGRW